MCNNVIASKSQLSNSILEFENKALLVWQDLKPEEIQFPELSGYLSLIFKALNGDPVSRGESRLWRKMIEFM